MSTPAQQIDALDEAIIAAYKTGKHGAIKELEQQLGMSKGGIYKRAKALQRRGLLPVRGFELPAERKAA